MTDTQAGVIVMVVPIVVLVLISSGSVRRYLAPDRGQPYPVPPRR